jgi:hypothetical protein
MGGTLLAVGSAGLITLAIYAAEATDASPWCQRWFLALFSGASLAFVTGVLFLLSVYVYVPFFSNLATLRERREQPRLVDRGVHVESVDHQTHRVVFEIGLENLGTADVPEAVVNLLAPDFVTALQLSTQRGASSSSNYSHTSESITPDGQASIYWNGTLAFPGRGEAGVVYGDS